MRISVVLPIDFKSLTFSPTRITLIVIEASRSSNRGLSWWVALQFWCGETERPSRSSSSYRPSLLPLLGLSDWREKLSQLSSQALTGCSEAVKHADGSHQRNKRYKSSNISIRSIRGQNLEQERFEILFDANFIWNLELKI